MTFENIVKNIPTYFPNVKIKYKDQSLFMKFLGKLLFFNPKFMTTYSTTINNTIYFPSEEFVKTSPVSAEVMLTHELVHVYDKNRIGMLLFGFAYLLPQILAPLVLPLLFVISWKFVLPLFLLLLAPLPSYFRGLFETRAYIASLYVIYLLSRRNNFNPVLDGQSKLFLNYVHGPSYYFAWPFANINTEFEQDIKKIAAGQRPYDDDGLFDILENLVAKS